MYIQYWEDLEKVQRFTRLEKRLLQNRKLFEDLSKCIKGRHMHEVDNSILGSNHYFLPHHGVIKEGSSSTKLHEFFDASFKTTDRTSLNDRLVVSPALQNNIIDIILWWRLYKFTFTAGIEKIYRQIWIDDHDSNYQLIFWRKHRTDTLKIYRLKTVTFGTASASRHHHLGGRLL